MGGYLESGQDAGGVGLPQGTDLDIDTDRVNGDGHALTDFQLLDGLGVKHVADGNAGKISGLGNELFSQWTIVERAGDEIGIAVAGGEVRLPEDELLADVVKGQEGIFARFLLVSEKRIVQFTGIEIAVLIQNSSGSRESEPTIFAVRLLQNLELVLPGNRLVIDLDLFQCAKRDFRPE